MLGSLVAPCNGFVDIVRVVFVDFADIVRAVFDSWRFVDIVLVVVGIVGSIGDIVP